MSTSKPTLDSNTPAPVSAPVPTFASVGHAAGTAPAQTATAVRSSRIEAMGGEGMSLRQILREDNKIKKGNSLQLQRMDQVDKS
ncbi:hypothetical protein AHAS_Ahas05G0073000 [Arachis hypogaea]